MNDFQDGYLPEEIQSLSLEGGSGNRGALADMPPLELFGLATQDYSPNTLNNIAINSHNVMLELQHAISPNFPGSATGVAQISALLSNFSGDRRIRTTEWLTENIRIGRIQPADLVLAGAYIARAIHENGKVNSDMAGQIFVKAFGPLQAKWTADGDQVMEQMFYRGMPVSGSYIASQEVIYGEDYFNSDHKLSSWERAVTGFFGVVGVFSDAGLAFGAARGVGGVARTAEMAGSGTGRLAKAELDKLIANQARLEMVGNTKMLVIGYDEATMLNLQRLRANPRLLQEDGYYILAHGHNASPNLAITVSNEYKLISSDQLATIMKTEGRLGYTGGGCTLLACFQGGPRGMAQSLANSLVGPVQAPRWALRVSSDSSGFEITRLYNGILSRSLGIGSEDTLFLRFDPLR